MKRSASAKLRGSFDDGMQTCELREPNADRIRKDNKACSREEHPRFLSMARSGSADSSLPHRKRPSRTGPRESAQRIRAEGGAFLFNFAKFIEWPQNAFVSPQSPFAICVFGKDPFGSFLDEVLANKTIGDRPISIHRPKDKMELRYCQIVFVSSSEAGRVADIAENLQGTHVLLVGESDGFAESGGMIEFTLEQGRVRFSINRDAAEHANLHFSSKLLALAKIVHGAARPGGG